MDFKELLTKDFVLDDFIVSRDHPDLLDEIKDNFTPSDRLKCFYLARLYLQPLRDYLNSPVIVLSGKRSEKLNSAILGAKNSDHLFRDVCAACDITVSAVEMELARIFLTRKEFVENVGQLIYYPTKHFFHISLPSKRHKAESFQL